MLRALKILAWSVGVGLAIPVVLVAVLLLGANTGPGRRLIETAVSRITQNEVRIEGLSGRFPDELRIRRIAISDTDGVWLSVADAALDWSPRRLAEGEVVINRLTAQSIEMARMPVLAAGNSDVSLPMPRGVVSQLRVARLRIDPAVAGQPIVLAVAGAGEIAGPDSGEAHLAATALAPRGDAPLDHYLLEMSLNPAELHATLSVAESAHGLIAGLAGLPELGAIGATVALNGPTTALAAKATVEAGSLRAGATGTIDAIARTGDLRFSVLAPAMAPAAGIGWSSIRIEGKVHGPLDAPEAQATLAADNLAAEGAKAASLRADVAGDATGKTKLQVRVDGLSVPGPSPDILAGGTLTLDASVQLAGANRPFQFSLRHVLFSADGDGDATKATARVIVPDLSPFAAVGGIALQGRTELDIDAARSGDGADLTVRGTVGIADGIHPIPALIGDTGAFELAASVHGADLTVSRFALSGAGLAATASGQFVDRSLSADWTVSLNQLALIRPDLSGMLEARGHAGGTPESLSLATDVTGNLAAAGQHLEQVTARITADGLPDALRAQVTAGGVLFGAPVDLAVNAEQRDGGFSVVIERAIWKSVAAMGTLTLAQGDSLPTGAVTLKAARLADLTPLLGYPIEGDFAGSVDSSAGKMRIQAAVTSGSFSAEGSISKASVNATITDPGRNPDIDGVLLLDGVEAGGVRASGRVTAKGPLDALDLTLVANSGGLAGLPGRLETSGRLNAAGETMQLMSLQGMWGSESVRLLAPARIDYSRAVTVDRLRLAFRQGELAISGGLGGGSALNATLVNLPADILAVVAPAYAADGTIAGEAHLTGNPGRPEGTIHITATGLRLRAGGGRALPPAASTVTATLTGTGARVDAKIAAGKSSVSATGKVTLDLAGPVDVHVGGMLDLAALDPLLAARGRGVKGRLDLNLGIGGSLAAPRATGTVLLSGGDLRDANLGIHLAAIGAAARADGNVIRLERFSAKAGQGTVAVDGTVSLAGTPSVDLSLRASNARVLSTDLATAVIDANLTLRGPIDANPLLGGTITARTADIRVPEKLPPNIAVLPVREAGVPPPPPPPPAATPDVALHLTLDAPEAIYVRGRGLDAELGGRVVFAGTAANPLPQGGLQLRRGTFSIAGQSLGLTEGTIDFSGGGLTNPTLRLVATSASATLTATVTISGQVRDPKIKLSSVPDLPQDEILSQLLFNTTRARLNPFQVAQVAAALASLSGVGPSFGDPLERVRSALGLDQLSIGSDSNGGPTLQAGRYLAPGVRVGATQSTGGQTQATVQIDIAKGLKLETTVGTGAASATPVPGGTTNGTGVGLLYQFEY